MNSHDLTNLGLVVLIGLPVAALLLCAAVGAVCEISRLLRLWQDSIRASRR